MNRKLELTLLGFERLIAFAEQAINSKNWSAAEAHCNTAADYYNDLVAPELPQPAKPMPRLCLAFEVRIGSLKFGPITNEMALRQYINELNLLKIQK